jgi:nucleoside-diphosphate-sugar epimerase
VKVLVTGADGHLGRAVTTALHDAGHRVAALDRRPAAATDDVHVGDAANAAVLHAALRDVEAVVHLAAIPTPEHDPPARVFAHNTQTTFAVLEEAGRRDVGKVVLASSLSALGLAFGRPGLSPAYAPIDEDHPTVAEDPYALSKLVDETTAAAMHRRHGTTTIALRFAFIAAGDRLDRRLRTVHADPAAASAELWGWVHTDDAAAAVLAALNADVTGHHVVNVAAHDTLARQPTAELLARHHPTTQLRAALPGCASPYSTAKARELLAFTPRHTRPQ